MQAVADLAEGILEGNVFEQTQKGQGPARAPGDGEHAENVGRQVESHEHPHAEGGVDVAEPGDGPERDRHGVVEQRGQVGKHRDGHVEQERVERAHEDLCGREAAALVDEHPGAGRRDGRPHEEPPQTGGMEKATDHPGAHGSPDVKEARVWRARTRPVS